jgi:hypothetical protein
VTFSGASGLKAEAVVVKPKKDKADD